MKTIREVINVKANDDFTLECEMENGEVYLYDISYVNNRNGEAINPLKNINNLKKIYIDYGALEWPSGYGLHGDTIVREGKLIHKVAA